MKRVALAVLSALACATPALSQEVITLDRDDAFEEERPRNAEDRARANGAWAQGVIDRARLETETGERPKARTCAAAAPTDGKPHGEVWGVIGTEGYRSVGGVMTQQLGPCADLTLGISITEGGATLPPARGEIRRGRR